MKKYRFDHEKLDAYQLELQFIAWVTPLIEEVKASAGSKVREACNHLDRASLSALFNTAEGNGKDNRICGVGFSMTQEDQQRNVLHAWTP